jgi:flagellar basal body-associated protein FliL
MCEALGLIPAPKNKKKKKKKKPLLKCISLLFIVVFAVGIVTCETISAVCATIME